MKTNTHILVSGASGIVGYGILRNLKRLDCTTIGTTIYPTSPANCFADIVEIVPKSTETGYINSIIQLIKKYHIDMIIPGIEADMTVWNLNRKLLESTGVFVLLNRRELITLCTDKWSFFKILNDNNRNYRIPSSITPDFSLFTTPFLLKPRCGYGAKGIKKIQSEDEFNKYRDQIGDSLMIQELVGTDDEEYTVSAFFDIHSKIRALIALKRTLSPNGYTDDAEVVDFDSFVPIIKDLSDLFFPIGPTNFQFRKHRGELKLLEINPRISSSTSIKTAFGYNECEMSINYFLYSKPINQPILRRGKVIRYIEDYVFYDCNNI